MKYIVVLFCLLFLAFSSVVNGQTTPESDSNTFLEKATYASGDLGKFLINKMVYPLKGFANNIQGDVIFSIEIRKDGTSDGLVLSSSDHEVLTKSAVEDLKSIENKWNPAKINGQPVDKKYLFVVRYRLYINTEPTNYKREALDFIRKQKYNKAIDIYDQAIKDNPYNAELFIARSQLKAKIGDEAGSKEDLEASKKIDTDILTEVAIMGRRVTTRTVTAINLSSFPR